MKNKRGSILIFMGLLLLAAALFLTSYNLYDDYRASRSSIHAAEQLRKGIPGRGIDSDAFGNPGGDRDNEIPDYILNPDMDMPVKNIDGQDYIGILSIPSLGLELPVISEWSYSRLKIAPCRYSGSAYSGNLIIAAHNYRSHFGSLRNLEEGSDVIFTDVDGNIFTYTVMVREILMSTDVQEMEGGGWDLTLFTCTAGGQNRVTVRCVRKEK